MKLNYKVRGEGEPLIIIHGLLGMLDNWASHARNLAEHFKVYTVDARNHGRSPHSKEMDYEVMVEDLNNFMDEQGVNEAHLLGHSMGGKIVMKFAQNYSYRVKKLIVADISPCAYPVHHDSILEALSSVPLSELEKRTDADDYLAEYINNRGIRQFLMKSLYKKKEGGYAWRFNLEAIKNNIERVGEATMDSRYEGDTLFIRGGNSDYVRADHFDDIELIFPNSKIETLEGAGHWLHAEQPEEFGQTVLEFLRE